MEVGMPRLRDMCLPQPHLLKSSHSYTSQTENKPVTVEIVPVPELKHKQASATESVRITTSQLTQGEHIALGGSRSDSKGRGDSRSRLKKIFESPRRPQEELIMDRNDAKKRLFDDLDIRNYIYKKDSAFYASFCDSSLWFTEKGIEGF